MSDMKSLASYVDHTNLSPLALGRDIEKLCKEAQENAFAAVCVNPWHVGYAARLLAGTTVGVATVIGFPLGATTTAVKVFEAVEAIKNGATEIDLVINIAALKEELSKFVRDEILQVRDAIGDAILKIIIEAPLLEEKEKRVIAMLATQAGADMLKTCTGFNGKATVEDVKLLRELAPTLGVKASGGIREAGFALELIAAGAIRIGTSSAIDIIKELEEK
jgi:deoxyribose-phosphate aldolase